jgi:hypothetical protein
MVCKGTISLRAAQVEIAMDWSKYWTRGEAGSVRVQWVITIVIRQIIRRVFDGCFTLSISTGICGPYGMSSS